MRTTVLIPVVAIFLAVAASALPILRSITVTVRETRVTFNFSEPVALVHKRRIKIFQGNKAYQPTGEVFDLSAASVSTGYYRNITLQFDNSTGSNFKNTVNGATVDLAAGAFQNPGGAENLGVCSFQAQIDACDAGEYIAPNGGCESCPSGKYSSDLDSANCTAWDSCKAPAEYVAMEGTGTRNRLCKPCGLGRVTSSINEAQCGRPACALAPNQTLLYSCDALTVVVVPGGQTWTIRGNHSTQQFVTVHAQTNRILSVEKDACLILSRLNLTGASPSTGNGGAIAIDGGRLEVTSSAVFGNAAQGHGGGIYGKEGAAILLKNVIVESNAAATGKGGGIFVEGGGSILRMFGTTSEYSVIKSYVVRNRALSGGGGIYCDEALCALNQTVVKWNLAQKGAGLMQEKGALAIKACYIEDNGDSSTLGGGGVYCTSGGALDTTKCDISSSMLRRNLAMASGDEEYGGGGVYSYGKVELSVKNSYLINNYAHSTSIGNEVFTFKKDDGKTPKTVLINVNFGQRAVSSDFFGGHSDSGTDDCTEDNRYCGTSECSETGICNGYVPGSCENAGGSVPAAGVRCRHTEVKNCSAGMHVVAPTFASKYENRMCDLCSENSYTSTQNENNCKSCAKGCDYGLALVGNTCSQRSSKDVQTCELCSAGKFKMGDAVEAVTWHEAFEGHCDNGHNEYDILVFQGNGDNGGTEQDRIRACGKACLVPTPPLNHVSWDGFDSAGFAVEPSSGKCYCEASSSKKCLRVTGNNYRRYDYVHPAATPSCTACSSGQWSISGASSCVCNFLANSVTQLEGNCPLLEEIRVESNTVMTIEGVYDGITKQPAILANAVVQELHSSGKMSYSDAEKKCTDMNTILCAKDQILDHLHSKPRDKGLDSWTPIVPKNWLQVGSPTYNSNAFGSVSSWQTEGDNSDAFYPEKRRVFCCPRSRTRHFSVEEDAKLVLKNVILSGGDAGSENDGGAVILLGKGILLAFDTTLYKNSAGLRGGGLYGSSGCKIVLYKSSILENTATIGGGLGVKDSDSEVSMHGGTIAENKALGTGTDQGGGGVSCVASTCTFTNVTISENTAAIGSGCYQNRGTLTLRSSLVEKNECLRESDASGGVYCVGRSSLLTTCEVLDKSTVRNNGCSQWALSNGGVEYYEKYASTSKYSEINTYAKCDKAAEWFGTTRSSTLYSYYYYASRCLAGSGRIRYSHYARQNCGTSGYKCIRKRLSDPKYVLKHDSYCANPITDEEECKAALSEMPFSLSHLTSESHPYGCWMGAPSYSRELHLTINSGKPCGTGGHACICRNTKPPEISVVGNVRLNLYESFMVSGAQRKIHSTRLSNDRTPLSVVRNSNFGTPSDKIFDGAGYDDTTEAERSAPCSTDSALCGEGTTCLYKTQSGVDCICNIEAGHNITLKSTCRVPTVMNLTNGSWTVSGAVLPERTKVFAAQHQRHFKITGGTLLLENLALVAGSPLSGDGGAIHIIDGSLVVRNVTFFGNSAGDNGRGGALYAWNVHTAQFSNVRFVQNFSPNHGGAIYFASNTSGTSLLKLTESSHFTLNRVGSDKLGGAVFINGADFVFTESVAEFNAAFEGAFLYANLSSKGAVNIQKSRIEGHRAIPGGGATLHFVNSGEGLRQCSILDSLIDDDSLNINSTLDRSLFVKGRIHAQLENTYLINGTEVVLPSDHQHRPSIAKINIAYTDTHSQIITGGNPTTGNGTCIVCNECYVDTKYNGSCFTSNSSGAVQCPLANSHFCFNNESYSHPLTISGMLSKPFCMPCSGAHKSPANTLVSTVGPIAFTTSCVCTPGYVKRNDQCESCPAGTHHDQTECKPCPAGKYSGPGALECTLCATGRWSNVTQLAAGRWGSFSEYSTGSAVSCVPCAPGKYSSLTGQSAESSCSLCPVGKYSDSTAARGSDTCIDCNVGTYSTGSGQSLSSSCINCPSGRFGNTSGGFDSLKSCHACSKGFYCPGNGSQFSCTPGTYNNLTGSVSNSSCISCGPGKYGLQHAQWHEESCNACEKGYFCTGGAARVACPTGAFNNITHRSDPDKHCLACPGGKYGIQEGQENETVGCLLCQPGLYCPGGDKTYPCETGTYNNLTEQSSNASCVDCPAGTYGNIPGQQTCLVCQLGYFCIGRAHTSVCAPGKYNQYVGQSTPSACTNCPRGSFCQGGHHKDICPPGTYGGQTNLSSVHECTTCPAGYYCNGNTSIVGCPNGTFSLVERASALHNCAACPPGSYCFGLNHTQLCPSGTYGVLSGTSTYNESCEVCEPGFYCSGGAHRASCPVGTYNIHPNKSFVQDCVHCSPGKYGLNASQASETLACIPCERGHVCAGTANRTACPIGRYNSKNRRSNFSSCEFCSRGKYGTTEGQWEEATACVVCEAGYFCPLGEGGYPLKRSCPAGTFNRFRGQHRNSSCSLCPPGRYGTMESQRFQNASCKLCEKGHVCFGRTHRSPCPVGRYNNKTGQFDALASCQKCPVGTFGEDAGQANHSAACLPCSAGKFSNIEGGVSTAVCNSCTPGKWANVRSSSCMLCVPGKWSSVGGNAESACVSCAPGTFTNATTGNISPLNCTACPTGKFSPGGTECLQWQTCPFGYYTSLAGNMTHDTRCSAMQATVIFSLPEHVAYSHGTRLTVKIQNTSAACMSRNSTPPICRSHATSCAIGTLLQGAMHTFFLLYGQQFRVQPCIVNDMGQHVFSADYPSVVCPKNTYNKDRSGLSTHNRSCKPCPLGRFINDTGTSPLLHDELSDCKHCVTGKHLSQSKTKCIDHSVCPPGTFVLGRGYTSHDRSCQPCAAGKFSKTENAVSCRQGRICPAGTFVFAEGNRSHDRLCRSCEPGSFAATPNQGTCMPFRNCSAGMYIAISGSQTSNQFCGSCTGDQFANETNQKECHPFADCLPPQWFVGKEGTNKTDRICSTCAFYQHSVIINSHKCVNGPADTSNLLLLVCLGFAVASCLLHFVSLCICKGMGRGKRRPKSSPAHVQILATSSEKRTKIVPKPQIDGVHRLTLPAQRTKVQPNGAALAVHRKLLKDFRMTAKSAQGRLHRQFVAARAIPHLIEINDIDHLLLAVNHAQGMDGGASLPPLMQKFLKMGVSYLDGVCEKAIQDVAAAVQNKPPKPMQYERLDLALKRALKFNVGVGRDSKRQGDVGHMLLTASQLRGRLEKLWTMRQMVETMDQRSVAEIRSFKQPKFEVEHVMKATLILLGTDPIQLQTWGQIKVRIINVGTESLRFRIKSFVIERLSNREVALAEELLHGIEVDRIASISAGATIFYRWSTSVCLWVMSQSHDEDSITRRASKAAEKVVYDVQIDGWGGGGGAMPKVLPTHTPKVKEYQPLTTPSPNRLEVDRPAPTGSAKSGAGPEKRLLISKPSLSQKQQDREQTVGLSVRPGSAKKSDGEGTKAEGTVRRKKRGAPVKTIL